MLLTLNDGFAASRCYAVDENGTVWMKLTDGTWGRGCLFEAGHRHFFLRPSWALAWTPLPLGVFQEHFAAAAVVAA
jgi:hypothetical protein